MASRSPSHPVGIVAAALSDLARDLRRFSDAAERASATAVDDRPAEDIPPPLESCIDAIGDLHVLAHELVVARAPATAAREYVIAMHEGVNRMREPLKTAISPASMKSVARVGQSRRREWQLWAEAMRLALEQLDTAFAPLDERLLACWKAVSAGAKS